MPELVVPTRDSYKVIVLDLSTAGMAMAYENVTTLDVHAVSTLSEGKAWAEADYKRRGYDDTLKWIDPYPGYCHESACFRVDKRGRVLNECHCSEEWRTRQATMRRGAQSAYRLVGYEVRPVEAVY
jgi:hypothetical protein